jgi:hypothetical protein
MMLAENRAHVNYCLAVGLAEVGLAVMPVRLHRLGGKWRKDPLIKNWKERASADPTLVAGWWRQYPWAVPGIVLEMSGLVVVDADRHPGGPDGVAALARIEGLPPHPVIATRGGGEHHYFRQPEPPISFGRWAGGEVLGTSKFAVAYGMVDPAEVPELPGWVLRALPRVRATQSIGEAHTQDIGEKHINMRPVPRTQSSSNPSFVQSTLSAPVRSARLVRCVEHSAPGNRNNLLHWAACRFGNMVGEGKLQRNVAEHLLISAAKTCGLWREDGEAQCRATIRSGLDVGIEEMRKTAS